MRATFRYHNGNCLVIAKDNMNSMLLLEALSFFSAGSNFLHKVCDDIDKNRFYIYLNLPKKTILAIAEYINANTDNS